MDRRDDDPTERTEESFIDVVGGSIVVLSDADDAVGASVLVNAETGPVVVGRAAHCGVSIADPRMSMSHCELAATEWGVRVTDLESLNGTYLNQVRLKAGSAAYLTANGRMRCGHTWIEVRVAGREKMSISGAAAFGPLIGRSPRMRELYTKLEKFAPTDLSVLITGETGTGKELVAEAIRGASRRRGAPFITVDCTTISPALAESALFGHEKGAFTGAVSRLTSPFVLARGGTVFLDELGELPEAIQPKLLRALEARQIQAVGSTRYEPIDVRIIAATRRDMHVEMNAKRFRDDLYYRIAQATIETPPLRKHPEDIPALVAHFLADLDDPGAVAHIDKSSMDRLMRHDWPGNVRELRNVILVAHAQASGGAIEVADLLSAHNARTSGLHLSDRISASESFAVLKDEVLAALTRGYFTKLHAETGGTISAIARRSGLARSSVRAHLERLGLHGEDSPD
jgi:DNA-binding NtrC family response regulator